MGALPTATASASSTPRLRAGARWRETSDLEALAFLFATELGRFAARAIAGLGLPARVGGPLPAWLRRGAPGETTAGPAAGAPEGLAVGTPAPGYRFPGLSGDSHTHKTPYGPAAGPLLLLFSERNCGPCIEMAPVVARWQRQHSDELTIAVVERDHDGDVVAPD